MFILGALRVLAAAVAVVSPSPAPTQAPEIAHVVTSDRSEQTLRNTTRTTYVVDAATIARRGYATVSDALADVPGVEINRYGAIGSIASYGIRGSSSAQVLVLVNGAPAIGQFGNTVALSTMATTGVRRIEVVEGGGSTLYGTGAIGGIINVITDSQSTPPAATLRLGSFGERSVSVSGSGFSIDRVVSQNAYDLPAGTKENDDYEATTARYGLDHIYGPLLVSLRTSLESDHLGAPGPLDFASTTSREDDVNADASLSFTWKRRQSNQVAEFGGGRQQVQFECDSSGIDPNCFLTSPAFTTEARTSLGLHNTVSGATERVIYGVDLSRGFVRSDDGFGDIAIDALAQSAAYVQQNWQTKTGELYAGVRGERDGSLGAAISPSLGWRTSIGHAFVLKANVANAFRAPNASELYFPGYGNRSLVPERASVGDLAITDPTLLGGVTFGWFTNHTSELIVATALPSGAYTPKNVDHALMQGFTLDAKTASNHGFSATLGVTNLYHATNLDTRARLPNDPVMSADLGFIYENPKRGAFEGAGVNLHGVSTRYFVSPEPAFEQSFGYSTIAAYARFRVADHVLLTLRGNNLGNARYAEISGYPMPPHSFTIELSTK